jgi:hypothetical protein
MKIETTRALMTVPVQPTRAIADKYRRRRSIARARSSAIPTNPRWGRVMRGCRRGLIAGDGSATVSQLRQWCYAGRQYRPWHCGEIRRALKQIGARQIGRATGMGAPGIWTIP